MDKEFWLFLRILTFNIKLRFGLIYRINILYLIELNKISGIIDIVFSQFLIEKSIKIRNIGLLILNTMCHWSILNSHHHWKKKSTLNLKFQYQNSL